MGKRVPKRVRKYYYVYQWRYDALKSKLKKEGKTVSGWIRAKIIEECNEMETKKPPMMRA